MTWTCYIFLKASLMEFSVCISERGTVKTGYMCFVAPPGSSVVTMCVCLFCISLSQALIQVCLRSF